MAKLGPWQGLYVIVLNPCVMFLSISLIAMGVILRYYLNEALSNNVYPQNGAAHLLDSVLKTAGIPDNNSFSSPVGHAGLALIMVGILLTVVSLCGGFGAGCENPTLLLAFVVVSCVIFIGEAIVFAELLPPAQSFHEGARNGLVSHIRQFYQVQGHNTISTLLNQAMELAKCCGVEGPGDFKNLSLTYAHAGRVDKVKVPLACCNNDDDTDAGSASDREHRILRCAIYGDGDDLSLNGCYTPLLNALGDWETAVYLDFGFTVVLQALETVVAVFLLRQKAQG